MDQTVLKSFKSFLTIAAASGVLYVLYLSRRVLLYLILAALLAMALAPLVRLIQRKKVGRGIAALISMLAVLIVVVAISGTIATPFFFQGKEAIENLPAITQSILNNHVIHGLAQRFSLEEKISGLSQNASAILLGSGATLYGVFNNILGFFTSLSIVLVMSFFLLLEGPEYWQIFVKRFKPEQRARVEAVGKDMLRAVSGFVSGNLLISVIAGIVTLAAGLLLGVPYTFALAALVALFDLIPLVGTAIATIVVGLVALTQSLQAAILMVVILLVYQFIEGHVIQPAVYSRSIQLSPLLIIIATVTGAELGGIIGILLAIPLAGMIQILVIDMISYRAGAVRKGAHNS